MQGLGPRERPGVHLWALDRGCSKRLPISTGNASSLGGAEIVQRLVESGETHNTLKSFASSLKRSLAWIQTHALGNHFVCVLRHCREDIEE